MRWAGVSEENAGILVMKLKCWTKVADPEQFEIIYSGFSTKGLQIT